ncbi:DUF2797 domain-containing protein, partial [Streptomyces albidoflavus]
RGGAAVGGGAGARGGGLRDGAVVAGRLVGAAGPDLHLAREGSRRAVLVVDTRLMAGWQLDAAGEGADTDGVEVRAVEPAHRQGGLF